MSSVPAAVELLPPTDEGRIFTLHTRVRLGDVDRHGLLRLDATARLLQDVATDDASDAGLDRRFGWLVRRTLIVTVVPARLGEMVTGSTWCAGIGRAWAERRTRITGERGARIDSASLWVQIDVGSGRPARLAADFVDAYSASAAGRTVSARLSLGQPTTSGFVPVWPVRRTDLDPFGHVNNAATWAFVEEYAALGDRRGRAELEYLQPIELDSTLGIVIEVDGERCQHPDVSQPTDAWLMAETAVAAAARWTPTVTDRVRPDP